MMSCLESKGKVVHLVGYHQRDSWPVNMIGQTIIDGTVLKQHENNVLTSKFYCSFNDELE